MTRIRLAVLLCFAVVAMASTGDDTLRWKPPVERENGEAMTIEEVGGYEIRGFDDLGLQVWSVIIEDGKRTSYRAPSGIASYQIAVFDTNGLYSEFVDIAPSVLLPPGQGVLERPGQGWLER